MDDESTHAILPIARATVVTPLRADGAIGWRVSLMRVVCLSCATPPITLVTLTGWVSLGDGQVAEMSLAIPPDLFEIMEESRV